MSTLPLTPAVPPAAQALAPRPGAAPAKCVEIDLGVRPQLQPTSAPGALAAGLTGASLVARLAPAAKHSLFRQDGYLVWCGAITHDPASGDYYLIYSRWPERLGHHAWVTHSEIAVAVSRDPAGPWSFHSVILPGAGGDHWDAHVTHNPAVLAHDGKYYLYYMGNRGNGEYWNHRNQQRIGVAVADHPAGPWRRSERPVIDVRPGMFDTHVTSNPTVTRGPDGRFCMLYKGVGPGPLPKAGAVVCGVAFADHPLGPWQRRDVPVISNPDHPWAVEDPFVWSEGGRYYCIVKDFQGYFSHGERNVLVLLQSSDAIDWEPTPDPLFLRREIRWEDGTLQPLDALERPQVMLDEHGHAAVLSVACASDARRQDSFNLQFKIARPGRPGTA